jgi:hypothetical protein
MSARSLLSVGLVACVLAAFVGLAQVKTLGQVAPPPPPPAAVGGGEVGRYAVAAFSEGSTNAYGMIVICDTKTGQCWTKPAQKQASFAWTDRGTPVKAK